MSVCVLMRGTDHASDGGGSVVDPACDAHALPCADDAALPLLRSGE